MEREALRSWAVCWGRGGGSLSDTPAQQVSNPLDHPDPARTSPSVVFSSFLFILKLIVSVIWGRSLNFYCFSIY